ncbi:DUF3325 domain-containing protein [Pusillimonas sp.]|uniref:DUF3325 domain-containing protein n=1 Tax=Pusillimonas sp. TaxID=3040095 RepID=UPI0029A2BB42|nr:DUF3325 domain-containing protein [Pusillimonas sp.]MDX3895852.1 DUF3325 domain-containing protein [Pusillimonas sp.]
MTTMPLLLAVLCLSYAGMAALCLALERHYHQLTGRHEIPRAIRMALRILGAALLLGGLALCLRGWGPTVGWVAWFAWLTTGALAVALLASYAPRFMSGVGALSLAAGVFALTLLA